MGETFSLGRIAGIRIGLNWSWLVVFALISWTLAESFFPEASPGLGETTYWTMAVAAALLFFASLLLHELGHALQAQRDGMEIEGITLWLFGGVAKFKGAFPSAGAEFRIAIAGPLVSLALGLAFVGVAVATDMAEEVDAVAAYLGYINLALLVFNLLPALPLDGGRILRSILWHVKGDFGAATRTSTGISRGIAYAMIGGGVAMFVFQGAFAGAWLAFLGWFLLQASAAEARYVLTDQALGGLRVRDLMIREPVTVPPDMTLGRFMDDVVWSKRHTTYPVVEGGRAVGLLPFRCVAEVPRAEWDDRTVRDCMLERDSVPVLDEDDPLLEALGALGEGDVHRGLVVEDGRLVGLLSITDLARALELGGVGRRRRR